MNEVERVKVICREKRISIRQLEQACGFSNGYISQIKKGVFPSDRLFKIADYLGVPVSALSETAFALEEKKRNQGQDAPADFYEASIRLVIGKKPYCDGVIQTSMQAVSILGEIMCSFDREAVAVVNLQTDGRPINFSICSIGAINYSIASPREILKSSFLSNAANIILLHNHPSNHLSPSREDILMTDRLIKVCRLADIPLLDHIIVGNDINSGYFSMREQKIELFDTKECKRVSLSELDFAKQPETEMVAEQTKTASEERRR